MENAADSLVGQVIDDRYRIDVLVARGGMASVYRAHDRRLERTVAIKVMNRSLAEDPTFVNRFRREAKAAARLHHPNLVTVFDQGSHNGLVWLAMDFVPGHTLRQVIDVHAPLDPDRALGVIEQILQGLAAAHTAGFVHRDVKPENVLMTADGTMRLVDFGLTRAVTDDGETRDTRGVVLGTVAYMAPEQVESARADARSDIYATGIVLFEMLTGTVPFSGQSPLAVAYRHVHETVPAPSGIRPDISPDVDELVRRATAKNPADRYRDVEEFLSAVRLAELEPPSTESAGGQQDRKEAPLTHSVANTDTVVVPGAVVDTTAIAPAGTIAARARQARTRSWDDISQSHGLTDVLDTHTGGTAVLADRNATTVMATTTWQSPQRSTQDFPREQSRVRSSRRFARTFLATFLVIVTSLVAVGAWWLGALQTTTLIDVRGMTVTEADQRLSLFGVDIEQAEQRYDADAAAGTIISTDPQPDSKVRAGAVVEAVVSLGPEPRPVPGVVGMSEQEAVAELESAGFTVTVDKPLRFVLVDRIYSQTPGSGTELTTGSTVTISLV